MVGGVLYGTHVSVWCRASWKLGGVLFKSGMHKCSTQKFVKHVGISLSMCLAALHCFPLQN